MSATRYSQQRERRLPPHIALSDLRAALGLTLDEVCHRIREEYPQLTPTRGSISAIELGHRGASAQMIEALTAAYGLRPGSIVTDYQPRNRTISDQVPA